MRKYENVDVIAALGAVVELNTAHYKSDFKFDIEQFKAAAQHPDGENNRLLWMSRQSGTWCVQEREAFIKDTEANHIWNGYATILGNEKSNTATVIVQDRILAYAVDIKGLENGRVKGDLYELDYGEQIRQLNRAALPLHTVTVKYEDGVSLTLPHAKYYGQKDRLYQQHGKVTGFHRDPEDADALREVLNQAWQQREKEARPAQFKVSVKNVKQPSIKQKIAAGKKQLAGEHAAAPKLAATKAKSNALEV